MRKGRDLIGKPIIAVNNGLKVTTIKDLIFSQQQDILVAVLTEEPGWFNSGAVVLISQIQTIGADGILIASEADITPAHQVPLVRSLLDRNNILRGTQVMTVSGRNLGRMVDLYFDTHTGKVEGYEVSGGIFADAYTGRSFVPTSDTIKIGEDYAFVPDSVIGLMEEQTGGLKAALIATGEKAKEVGAATAEKVTEVQNQVSTAVTDAIVTPEEQKRFSLGKTALADVCYRDGSVFLPEGRLITEFDIERAEALGLLAELYQGAGGDLIAAAKQKTAQKTEELKQKATETLSQATATLTVDEALGRRVRMTVYSPNGEIVAAVGQIVTEQTIERAHKAHQEAALMNATGLSVKDTAKSQSQLLAGKAGHQAQDMMVEVQSKSASLLDWVKYQAENTFQQGKANLEAQRIKGALGRPVNRVIFDSQDQVLLNQGDLVTHQSIEAARQADVLDILLDSIQSPMPAAKTIQLQLPANQYPALSSNH
jgi:uncharacterized protein YrrD